LAPGSTNISPVHPSFEIPTETISDWLNVALVRNRSMACWYLASNWHWRRAT